MAKVRSAVAILREYGLDDREIFAAVQSLYPRLKIQPLGRRWEFFSHEGGQGAVGLHNKKGGIESVSISKAHLQQICDALEDDKTRSPEIVRSSLASYRLIAGFARVEGWLQIRPIGTPIHSLTPYSDLADTLIPYPGLIHPFALEVAFKPSKLPFLDAYRRTRSVQEATWLLTAFLDDPVMVMRQNFCFATIDHKPSLVQCAMPPHGLESASHEAFSDTTSLPELPSVPTETYFKELGFTTSEFRVPDLGALRSAFTGRTPDDRLRFLRACAALSHACAPGETASQQLVAAVSAIEPFIPKGAAITAGFEAFLEDHVKPPAEIGHLFKNLYAKRSSLTHGSWSLEVDGPFLGMVGDQSPLVAWGAAKKGLIHWLLNPAPLATSRRWFSFLLDAFLRMKRRILGRKRRRPSSAGRK